MNCPKCGENNPDGGSFCKACGAALPNATPQPQSNKHCIANAKRHSAEKYCSVHHFLVDHLRNLWPLLAVHHDRGYKPAVW